MNRKIIIPSFFIMSLVQLYIPASMILNKENVIAEGKEFRFKTAPVDPTDPFRGKYIVLSFEENAIQVTNADDWNEGDPIYINLGLNDEGFAKISSVTKEKPLDTDDYVKATIDFIMNDSLRILTVQYPFDRFYMEESKAYDAEQAYLESNRDSTQVTYALVRVKNGDAVITDVIINGVSVKEAAENRQEAPEN